MRNESSSLKSTNWILFVVVGISAHAALCGPLLSQTPAFSVNPGKMEVEVNAGTEKTVAFEITASSAPVPERARIIISPTDWSILEDGSLTFSQPSLSTVQSATPWVSSSPAAFTLESARTQVVRLTVTVPEKTPPGVYRTGLFVQERPSAAPPQPGLRVINVRVRYVFLLYVLVPPVASNSELVSVEVDVNKGPPRLVCEMNNDGNRHARPLIFWSVQADGVDAKTIRGKLESTVLLPGAKMREAHSLEHLALVPGHYKASVLVDFQDGRPQQAMSRDFDIFATTPPETKAAVVEQQRL